MDISSLALPGSKKSFDLSRNGSQSGFNATLHPTTASELAACLLENFATTLFEADSYITVFESRVKMEEDYNKNLRALADKQKEMDARVNSRMMSSFGQLPELSRQPGLRKAWRELRENDSRELDTRSHMVEALRETVIGPLLAFRDSQERIRKRVKEDLKTSLSNYDEMRFSTLPRIRKAYEKKAEEVEQLRLQQQAIEDQRALLSNRSSDKESTGVGYPSSSFSNYGSEPPTSPSSRQSSEQDTQVFQQGSSPVPTLSRSRSKRHGRRASSGSARSLGGSAAQQSSDERSPGSSPQTTEATLTSMNQNYSIQQGLGNKSTFFEALKSKEGWDAARKEAPKKLGAFISRMREGRESSTAGHSSSSSSATAVGSGESSGAGLVGSSSSSGDHPASLIVGLASTSGTIRSAQNIALKHVKAKREADEADKAYRKAIFDLETLRLRRQKTLAAAAASVIECRTELSHTAQAVWMQAERSLMASANAALRLREHGEFTVSHALDNLHSELKACESGLPSLKDIEEKPVTYHNYWHGELKNLIFGTPLTDYPLTVTHRLTDGSTPPLIVSKCIAFIETYALDQPGIYRTSPKHSAIRQLAIEIEKDEAGFQFDPSKDDPATVAGVFKDYLRQLPEPVMAIPWSERIRYTHEREDHIRTGFAILKGRIRRLPPIHQATLKVILQHLSKVAAHSDLNRMTAANLSVVFSPCLLSEADYETTSVAAAMEEDKTMEDLIMYCGDIFDLTTAGAPILPPITQARSDELSKAGLGAAKSVFESSDKPPMLQGATDLKRSNAINVSTVSVPVAADGFEAGELVRHAVSQNNKSSEKLPDLSPMLQVHQSKIHDPTGAGGAVSSSPTRLSDDEIKVSEGAISSSPRMSISGNSAMIPSVDSKKSNSLSSPEIADVAPLYLAASSAMHDVGSQDSEPKDSEP
ncbi:RhoGAP-domain-containing protein [Violaceomyces palustris]|uniref:RhoGAP-domain-containing protein n=1 Tax=Violaceomyces palustris TaxID=1673888 RepID=A0ACD0P1J4_9BASI|nr:RhoGAP-domain-containing protein [Violaceomyces palustris]